VTVTIVDTVTIADTASARVVTVGGPGRWRMTVPRVVTRLPSEPGVYRFRDERGRALYLGRATDLRRRVASYWGELADRRHLRRMMPQVHRVEAVSCDSVHEAAWLELNLLERARPRWNRMVGGLEVPVWIRLETRSRVASLAVVHSPESQGDALVFGPYLGGGRARLTVSGLDRVVSLAYAGEGLGGFDRDMARVRGVRSGELRSRVETVAAVLGRDPVAVAAVREHLVRRRDQAAARLAFELAGRIQEELDAVAWVTSEQKVTVPEAVDVDVHGWADGVLVRFEIRGGRLCAWRQRVCRAEAAEPLVAATPGTWARFARRNAELAGRLYPPGDRAPEGPVT